VRICCWSAVERLDTGTEVDITSPRGKRSAGVPGPVLTKRLEIPDPVCGTFETPALIYVPGVEIAFWTAEMMLVPVPWDVPPDVDVPVPKPEEVLPPPVPAVKDERRADIVGHRSQAAPITMPIGRRSFRIPDQFPEPVDPPLPPPSVTMIVDGILPPEPCRAEH